MCAFCADSTCLASSGMAWLLISWSRRVPVGYRMAFTAVIFPAAMLTSTWTGPYLVASAVPSTTTVPDAAADGGGPDAAAVVAPVEPAPDTTCALDTEEDAVSGPEVLVR